MRPSPSEPVGQVEEVHEAAVVEVVDLLEVDVVHHEEEEDSVVDEVVVAVEADSVEAVLVASLEEDLVAVEVAEGLVAVVGVSQTCH